MSPQKLLIPTHVREHFAAMSLQIETRLRADQTKYNTNVEREHITRFLSSDSERRRRRVIIQVRVEILQCSSGAQADVSIDTI